MKILIDGIKYNAVDKDELIKKLCHVDNPFQEAYFYSKERNPSLTVLRNKEKVFLMYLKYSGDAGYTSRSNSSENMIDFQLSNGQVDSFPENWTISFQEAIDAIECFYVQQKMSPDILWNDDSKDN